MKALFHLAVCGALLASGAMAQRGGGGHGGGGGMGGGMRGGGMMGGGGMRGGGMMGGGRGGMGGGGWGGSRGGGWGAVGGSRGGSWGAVGGWGRGWGGWGGFRGVGFRGVGGCGWGGWCGNWGGWGWGGWGLGWGWPSSAGYYGYPDSYYGDYSYADPSYGSPGGYPGYASQPSVNVIYPPAPAQTSVYVEHANPVMREYDQYGQQVGGSSTPYGASDSSPVYLIATKDHNIYAALAYSTAGSYLQYTTLDHQQRRVPLDQLDRDLTMRLNRERHVSFQMPQ
jgi:hypothetical protein